MREFLFRYRVWMVAIVLAALSSCIKNDIPYPYIELYITSVEGDGFTTRTIDNTTRTVYLTLDETTDIEAVNITDVAYTDGATLSTELVGVHDMRLALKSTLSQYQNYDWQIIAEQEISYEFTVVGQIGSARIDSELLTVGVDVNENTVDLDNVDITTMKLGPADITTYDRSIEDLEALSFDNTVRRVTATAHGRDNTWSIRMYAVEPTITFSAYAWGKVAWLRAEGDTSDPTACWFEYKERSSDVWIEATPESCSGGVFEMCLTGLSTETDYDFRAIAGSAESEIVEATTESTPLLPNSGFEEWSDTIENWWSPYIDESNKFWGTGNKGAATAGAELTTPDSTEVRDSSTGIYSAKLESKNVIVKFAAGSIFAGEFYAISGVNGIIDMGQPFTQRPLALEGYAKYLCSKITHTKDGVAKTTDDYDEAAIYIALGTWDAATYGGSDTSPVRIDTRYESSFFNKDGDDVIAYGELYLTESTDGWEHFRIDLVYKDGADGTSAYGRVPTHMMLVCSSSRYGDYFVGGAGSTLWLDDFSLIY